MLIRTITNIYLALKVSITIQGDVSCSSIIILCKTITRLYSFDEYNLAIDSIAYEIIQSEL